jgi:Domain of unknown function (DUF4386)
VTVLDTASTIVRDEIRLPQASAHAGSDEAAWYWALSRAALLTALIFTSMFVIMGVFIGFGETGPHEYVELLQAQRAPLAYRIFSMADIFVWLGIGMTLLAFGALYRRVAPIRAALLAACGLGQLVGATGGSLRLYAVTDLAVRHAAATLDQQPAIVSAYLTVDKLVGAHFNLGALLYGIGFVLIAWTSVRLVGFPRWLAVWFALSGTIILVLNALGAATTAEPEVWGLTGLVVFVLALHFGVAAAFWRRGRLSSRLVTR